MAALAVATDFAMGQPAEHALRSCVVAMRLGEALGYSDDALRAVYYEALLRFIGCNVDTQILASIAGDELVARARFAEIDTGRVDQVMGVVVRLVRAAYRGGSLLGSAREIARAVLALPALQASFQGHCEVAQRLARRLGVDDGIVDALGQLYERWDGRGLPRGIKGDAIAPAVRVVTLAQDAVIFARLDGVEGAVAIAKRRRGRTYDPAMCDVFCRIAGTVLAGLDDISSADVLRLEPRPHATLLASQLTVACEVIGDFADLKTRYTLGHSSGVAALARGAAGALGLSETEQTLLAHASLVHDVGRVAVSTSIWEKAGSYGEAEWDRVKLHPYYTERILARAPSLGTVAAVAASSAERLDGTGYHRALDARSMPAMARVLAAADVCRALAEPRAHRAACEPNAVADELRKDVRRGRLDSSAVQAVLGAAGASPRRSPEQVGGLTLREVDVLRLVARGLSIKQIGARLDIAPKTVDAHIQHMYAKLGVSTRAGATLFACEHHLVD